MRVKKIIPHAGALGATLLATLGAVILGATTVRADVLYDQTNLIGTATLAAPVQYSFTESTSQALTLTLRDEVTPAAFGGLQVAVTLGDSLVGSGTVDAATHVATVNIPAAVGTYTVHIVGTPNPTQGIGLFGVCVAAATSASSCIANYSYSGNIFAPSPASNTPSSALDATFTSSAAAGTYTVTITDDAFPVALQALQAGITQGSTVVTTTPLGLGTAQVTLQANTAYILTGGALADAIIKAGLYGVQIQDPTGAKVFDRTFPVGNLSSSTAVNDPAAQALNLTVTDEKYPAALAGLGAAVTNGGSTLLAKLTTSGTVSNFTAPAGSLQLWQYAVAGAQPGVYSLKLAPTAADAAALLSATQVVNPSGTGTTSYAFVVTLPQAASYTLSANDFQFPDALQSISATVAQNGTVLAQSAGGGFTAAQGPVVILVDAAPPASGSGMFGVTVETSGASPQTVAGGEFVQGVGGVFNSQSIILGISGNFDVTLADLGFPQDFANLAAVVSSDGKVLGKIYGGGTFPFAAVPGTYLLTFVATPSTNTGTQGVIPGYGLYLLNVASAPPSITLTSSASSVTAGSTVTLTWSSQNTTSCTASGGSGWTGNPATSGSLAVVIAATETLTLTCTGAGGSASQSITVTATTATAAASSSGGGGAIGTEWLLALLVVWGFSARSRMRLN